MEMNKIGKFDSLRIVNEFDRALIDMYGINMTDARITRYEVLATYSEIGCPTKAVEKFAAQRGMKRLGEAAPNA